jgi:hypothetical protein
MKIFLLLIFFVACLISCEFTKSQAKPDSKTFELRTQKCQEVSNQLWKKKEYVQAIALLKDSYSDYQALDAAMKSKYANVRSTLFYNLACGFALLQQNDSALVYLQKAVEFGYSDYYRILKDSDLNSLRDKPEYHALVDKMKQTNDFEFIIKQAKTYKPETKELPHFTIQEDYAVMLVDLRTKYKLDSVAGNGDEVSQIIRLMQWVHQTIRHDGNSKNPSDTHADALIEVCKKENRGVNCRMLATILNEVYLAKGYKSHFVTCLPKSKTDPDCHVINSVYSKTLKKWLWMDPTFETWVKDENGNLLSIQEVRERLISGFPLEASPKLNWNGNPNDPKNYLHNYMAKNLFQFNIPRKSSSGYENCNYQDRWYVQLISVEYQKEHPELNGLKDQIYYTTDSEQFWKHPN